MHPTDHTSIALVYSAHDSRSSGARYHRVTTYSVMNVDTESPGSASAASTSRRALAAPSTRASPKSQIFKSQLAFKSRLLGFKSRCNTFALWMYFKPRKS